MLHRAFDFKGFFGTIYANGTHGTNPPATRALLSLQWLAVHILHTRQQNVFLWCAMHRCSVYSLASFCAQLTSCAKVKEVRIPKIPIILTDVPFQLDKCNFHSTWNLLCPSKKHKRSPWTLQVLMLRLTVFLMYNHMQHVPKLEGQDRACVQYIHDPTWHTKTQCINAHNSSFGEQISTSLL
jgi:hypothetical protein